MFANSEEHNWLLHSNRRIDDENEFAKVRPWSRSLAEKRNIIRLHLQHAMPLVSSQSFETGDCGSPFTSGWIQTTGFINRFKTRTWKSEASGHHLSVGPGRSQCQTHISGQTTDPEDVGRLTHETLRSSTSPYTTRGHELLLCNWTTCSSSRCLGWRAWAWWRIWDSLHQARVTDLSHVPLGRRVGV